VFYFNDLEEYEDSIYNSEMSKSHTWVNTTPGLTFIDLCLISLTLITW